MHSILLVLLFCTAYVSALHFVSNALGSNMVLQRAPQRANLWGWSKQQGSVVTVTFNSKTYTATSGAGGAWSVMLDPTNAGGPYTINVGSNAGEFQALSNVLFGDVYVCSGQSNMQMTVHSVFNATDEIAAAANYPNIRVYTVGQSTFSATPLAEFANVEQFWSVASPESIGAGDWSAFSATCWFFGKNLYDKNKVPLGLFSSNWGGTPVEAWSSPDALAKCKKSELVAVQNHEASKGPGDASQLYNAMIIPILPMTIFGATWYQGEANSGNPNGYACSFPAMIADWRAKWGGNTDKTFGFYFVQLGTWASGGGNDGEGLTRLSQLYALALPKVGFATAADLGDPTSPFGDIHPRSKQEVGRRLALAARGISYGESVQYMGPMATGWQPVSANTVTVTFSAASVGGGLVKVPKTCDAGVPPNQCAEFELGTDKGWVAANYQINGNTVTVAASIGTAKITGVRYAYANYPIMSLQNKDGLPAIPFVFPNPITPNK